VSDDFTARLWDTATGKELAVLNGHKGPVVWAAFSPDSTRLVTTSWDQTARVWAVPPSRQALIDLSKQRLQPSSNKNRSSSVRGGQPPAADQRYKRG
jgi:WD40 repeat protein